MKKSAILLFSILLTHAVVSAQSTYVFDKAHARLAFSVTHFGISHVEGNFKNFDATLKAGKADFSDAIIEMRAEVNSINTDNETRDKDLRGADWFETDKYPAIVFKSSSFKLVSGNNYKLEGTLTMHGVVRPVAFDVVYNGKILNPFSKKYSVGFSITGKLNRTDYSLGNDTFANVVGKEVELKSEVEFIINSDATGLK